MNFDEFKTQLMQDPEFKKAYDDLEPEYAIIRAAIDGRSEKTVQDIIRNRVKSK